MAKHYTHIYGELAPDQIIDIFYDRIKREYENQNQDLVDVWVRNIIKANGDKLPKKIKNLLDTFK